TVPKMMNRLLEPAEPVVLYHVIRVDRSSSTLPHQYYDIDLSLDHPIRNRMTNVVNSNTPSVASQPTSAAAQVVQYDDQIANIIALLKLNCEKIRFLRGFSEQPTAVLKRCIDQQQKSLDQILATEVIDEESGDESEEE